MSEAIGELLKALRAADAELASSIAITGSSVVVEGGYGDQGFKIGKMVSVSVGPNNTGNVAGEHVEFVADFGAAQRERAAFREEIQEAIKAVEGGGVQKSWLRRIAQSLTAMSLGAAGDVLAERINEILSSLPA